MIHFNRRVIVPSNIDGDDDLFPAKTLGLIEKKVDQMKPVVLQPEARISSESRTFKYTITSFPAFSAR